MTRNPMNRCSSTQRRSSRMAGIGSARSTPARPAKRSGCSATQPATSSFVISGPCGPCQALSRPNEISAASIAASVAWTGISSSGICCPVQRRSDSNAGCRRNRCVGCCIQTSMVMRRILATCDLGVASGLDGEEPPLAGDALQLVQPAVLELDARAGNEVLHGARHQHLPGRRLRGDTGAGVDRDSADVTVVYLAFPGVKAGSDLEPEATHLVADLPRAVNRPGGPVERSQHAVAQHLYLPAAKA